MAKMTKRISVKGLVDVDKGTIEEDVKDYGIVEHRIGELLCDFHGLDDVKITISYDDEIIPDE